jgi:hypothetical protein
MVRALVTIGCLWPALIHAAELDDSLSGRGDLDRASRYMGVVHAVDLLGITPSIVGSVQGPLDARDLPVIGSLGNVSDDLSGVTGVAEGVLGTDIPWVMSDCEFTDTSGLGFDFRDLAAGADSSDYMQEGHFALACKTAGRYSVLIHDSNNQAIEGSLLPVFIVSADEESPAAILLRLGDRVISSVEYETEGRLIEHFHILTANLVGQNGQAQIPNAAGVIAAEPGYKLVIVKR